jgi:hypothetical protein
MKLPTSLRRKLLKQFLRNNTSQINPYILSPAINTEVEQNILGNGKEALGME